MACAHAKFTGELGVCSATFGPGAAHLINGLYDAKLDHQPVRSIVGQQARMRSAALPARGRPELPVQRSGRVRGHGNDTRGRADTCWDRAIKSALTQRRPAVVIVPDDVQEAEYVEPPREHGATFSSVGWHAPHVVPDQALLDEAARILNEGEKVAILIGQGAAGARRQVERVADLLGAGVAKALLGKACPAGPRCPT